MEYIAPNPFAFQQGLNLIEAGRQNQAQTEAIKSQTAERNLSTEIKADAFKRNQTWMEKLAAFGSPAALAATSPPSLIAGQDTPDAAAELAAANGTAPPKAAPPSNLTQLSKQQKPWEKDLAEADRNDALAKIAEQTGQQDQANKYRDDAARSRKQAVEAQQKQAGLDSKSWTRAYDMASAVRDEGSFQYVMSQLNAMGDGTAEKMGFKLGPDGKYVFDDAAVAKVAAIKEMALTQKDRLEFEAKAATLADQKARTELMAKKNEELASYHDRIAAARQAGDEARAAMLEAKREALRATMDAKDAKDTRLNTQNVQSTLDKNEAVRLFPKYEQSFNTARMINDQIANDTKYQKITAPQIDSLRQAYMSMANAYRARAGGKADQQTLDKFNGLTQNVEKYLLTIGQGTPKESRDTSIKIYNAMEDMYAIAAADTFKAELEARRAGRTKGADVDAIQYKALNDEGIRNLLAKKGILKAIKKDERGRPLEVEILGRKFDVSKDLEAE